MAEYRYYDKEDIVKISDQIRNKTGMTRTMRVSDMPDILENTEFKMDRVPSNIRHIYVKWIDDISPYRTEPDRNGYFYNYPRLTYKDGIDYQDYIFAGFFLTEECVKTESVAKSTTTGGAYAKFVNIRFFTLKYQITASATMESESVTFRSIFCLADTDLSKLRIGYRLGSVDATRYAAESSSTYTGMNSGAYKAVDFHPDASRIAAISFSVANASFNSIIVLNGSWCTMDGTYVYGYANIHSIADQLNVCRHIPIVLNNGYEATSATFDVYFNQQIFAYSGFNNPGLMENLSVDSSDVEKGILHITASSDTAVVMNDSVVDLIFTDVEGAIKPHMQAFKVNNAAFYNNLEPVCTNALLDTDFVTLIARPTETAAAATLALEDDNDGLITIPDCNDDTVEVIDLTGITF